MRIAIDASRTTVARVTGTERYALQLIRALIALNTEHEITLYFRDKPESDLFPPSERVKQRIIPFQRLWTHLRFARAIWHDRPNVTFVPAHTLPFVFPGKSVVTVHDLGYKYFPEAHPAKTRWYLDMTTRYSANRANVILADSQATAHDLTRFYGTSADKIRVAYPGVDAPHIAEKTDIHGKYHLPEKYLLFLGTLQPRKNIARIVQAYAQFRQSHPDIGLVLAGGQGWLYDPAWIEGVEGITLTGYIDDSDIGALYHQAEALVFPSLYEGFGFPTIEAMHCGTPVIASNTSSLPELVADAGILVNPESVEEIASAMHAVMERDFDKATLKAQAQKFTWEQCARDTLQALESAVR